MIIYIDTKSGKVDITKAELEKLLKEKYDEGYKDGVDFCRTPINFCPYEYGSCPYNYKWPYPSSITLYSTEGTINREDSTTSNIAVDLNSTHPGSTTSTITFEEK